MAKPKILVFASGSADGGGSGFEKLVESFHGHNKTFYNGQIVGVVSNHAAGGVRKKADKFEIPFIHFPKPWTAEEYQRIAKESGAEFFAMSGWIKLVKGLDLNTVFNSKTVFNIHPGPLPRFGGKGFYGHHVHEAVIEAFKRGEITHSQVTMHFVNEEFDRGLIFSKINVKIEKGDDADSLGQRVNQCEHRYQSMITNMIVNGKIKWDGINQESLVVPEGYFIEQ